MAAEDAALPDRRRHRGPHPQDAELFAEAQHAALRLASRDLAWLLSRGYVTRSALKLVGDRHALRQRQRMAVERATCSDAQRAGRQQREVGAAALRSAGLEVDGYNVLITLEVALAGGLLLRARDGCLRDLASQHGHFKQVDETEPALLLLGEALSDWGVSGCTIYLDQPVSNSGRLAATMRRIATSKGWPWTVELVPSPDACLKQSTGIIASADSVVLDACGAWFNLARALCELEAARLPALNCVDFS